MRKGTGKGTVPMPTHRQPTDPAVSGARPGIDEAEAALVEHYPRLVRLAYLTLPPSLGRHRRVLAAHATVQHVLPGRRSGPAPAQGRRSTDASAYAWIRCRVLEAALAHGRGSRLRTLRAGRPGLLPLVVGLRLFPRAGGTDELALDQALSAATAAARAALALRVLEGLSEQAVRTLLTDAGSEGPDEALRAADRLASDRDGQAEKLLRTPEFDPCTVQTRPTDLLRRRHRNRLLGAAVAVVVTGTVLAVTLPHDSPSKQRLVTAGPAAGTALAEAVDPARLRRAPADEWADSSRVDFTLWPARGSRVGDTALLRRALRVWAGPDSDVQVSAAPGTSTAPPSQPPQLLYAGESDGAAVVLLHDGVRVARYAEPLSGNGPAALDFVRTDDADVTTAAAVVVSRTAGRARYLLAPWIAESTTRDLLAPDTPARDLRVSKDGVTDPVAGPAAGGSCASWPVMQLRSSEKIVERHAFLVTDLGDLSPAHLTYTPPPAPDNPPRAPREATGTPALLSWAHTACSLRELRGSGVRAVNNWAFAEQQLPERGGVSTWVCTRADTWRGPGRILVQFQRPGTSHTAPGAVVADVKDTALCSRFGQHVLAGAHWKAPSGQWYLLAAASRGVGDINAAGDVRAEAKGPTMAVRAPRDGTVRLTGKLPGGASLAGVGQAVS